MGFGKNKVCGNLKKKRRKLPFIKNKYLYILMNDIIHHKNYIKKAYSFI